MRGWPASCFALLLSALLLASAHQAWHGMLPSSLWLDDLWVATLVKCASLKQWLTLRSPVPCGFIGLLKLLRLIFGDGPGALQAAPFCARILAISAVAWLGFELTDTFGLALVAAAGLAVQSEFANESVRVKPYSLDALISVVLLGLAVHCQRRPSCRRLCVLGGASIVALPFSFPSAFVGPVLVALCALFFAYDQRLAAPRIARRALKLAAAFDAIAMLFVFAIAQQKSTPVLRQYWSANYVPTHGLSACLAFFMHGPGSVFFTGAFGDLPWLGLLEAIGIGWLLRVRWTRPLGVFVLVLYAALIASSALRMYPIGEPRIDSFLQPTIALLCAIGLTPLTGWRFGTQTVGVVASLGAIWQVEQQVVSYVPAGEKQLAKVVEVWVADPTVALLLFPWANWALAYYGRWPVELVSRTDSTNGFYALPKRPNTLVLRETWNGVSFSDYARQPANFDAQLTPLMAAHPERLVFYGSYGSPADYRAMLEQLSRHHYQIVRQQNRALAIAVLLELR